MIIIENSTTIARPAAEVFAFVSDVRNDPQWHADVLEAQLLEGEPVGKGSMFAIKMKPFMGSPRERKRYRSTNRRIAS